MFQNVNSIFNMSLIFHIFSIFPRLWLFNIARGIDNEPVTNRLLANSIGACKRFPGKQALKTPENVIYDKSLTNNNFSKKQNTLY